MRDVENERLERNQWGRYKMGRPVLYLLRWLVHFDAHEDINV